MRLYLGNGNSCIFTVEDEYKFVCAPSNSAAFDDLELPRTLVSRSRYSLNLKENFTNGASNPLHVWFYARVFGISGSNGAISGSIKSQDSVYKGVYKLAIHCITSQLVCRSTWCLVLGWGFQLSKDFYHRGVHTRIAVAQSRSRVTLASARLSCCQSYQCLSLNWGTLFCEFRPAWYPYTS